MNPKVINRYRHFGLRRPWLEHFFEQGMDCFTQGHLGPMQYASLRAWLTDAELLTKSGVGWTQSQLCKKLIPLGTDNPAVWAIIWTNLAYNSIIVKWYVHNSRNAETYNKAKLVAMLGDEYSRLAREDTVSSLLETLRLSPIGVDVGQGSPYPSPYPKAQTCKYIKLGWENPEPAVVLYSLYKYAERTGPYTFTLEQLGNPRETNGVDPAVIFGLTTKHINEKIYEAASLFPNYVKVSSGRDSKYNIERRVVLTQSINLVDVLGLLISTSVQGHRHFSESPQVLLDEIIIDSVIQAFVGQAKRESNPYKRDLGIIEAGVPQEKLSVEHELGFCNAPIMLKHEELLANIRSIQNSNLLDVSHSLSDVAGTPSLGIELNSDSCKLYFQTIFELFKSYGWCKFAVVVPSVSALKNVKRTFDQVNVCMEKRYGTHMSLYAYDLPDTTQLDRYSQNPCINILVINRQMFAVKSNAVMSWDFTSTNKMIYSKLDTLRSRRPIDIIRNTNPIVIFDGISESKESATVKSIKNYFNPLFSISYSSTDILRSKNVLFSLKR